MLQRLPGGAHVVVRVNNDLYASARERLDEIARSRGFEGPAGRAGRRHRARRLPDRLGGGGVIRERTAIAAAIDDLVGLISRPAGRLETM
jgi:flagellar assembly protein FliH